MPAVRFPLSSTPGFTQGEGDGRLLNAYIEKAGDQVYVRRVPGLAAFASTGKSGPRGALDVRGTMYWAFSGSAVKVSSGGSVTALSGTLAGTDNVTFAANNRVTGQSVTPDVVAVTAAGVAYSVTNSVAAYPTTRTVTGSDGTTSTATNGLVGISPNSVSFMDGYFLFTVADGRIFASGLNTMDVDPLSFATAEFKSDDLIRGFVWGGTFYACGSSTIEPWRNTAGTPFPLTRVSSVIPVGLLNAAAVAGHEDGWDGPVMFVGHDKAVHKLEGYDTRVVSTPDVERFIAANPAVEACCFTVRGHKLWCLSSSTGTWVYDLTTGQWHERLSVGSTRFRGSRSAKSNGSWYVGDTLSGDLLRPDGGVRTENGAALNPVIIGRLSDFPSRAVIPALIAHFTQSAGGTVAMRSSRDGGIIWTAARTRALDNAGAAHIRWNRLGLMSHHGLMVELTVSGGTYFSLMGASVPDPEARAP